MMWQFKVLVLVVSVVLAVVLGLVIAVLNRLRGYVNREAGIACIRCRERAFPLGTLTNLYRCHTCGNRFSGPRHTA
jgi:hypothetical protein